MNLLLIILSRLGLALTILPSILFLTGSMELDTAKLLMIVGTVFWLGTAPILQKQHENSLADTQDHI